MASTLQYDPNTGQFNSNGLTFTIGNNAISSNDLPAGVDAYGNPVTAGQMTLSPAGSGGGTNTTNSGNGGTPTGQTQQQPSGTSVPDELTQQLDAIFSPVFSALQGQENTLNQNYSTVPGEIQGQYDVSAQSLANQNTSGQRELGAQETAAGTRKEDALTSATRLYNELQRGGQQRFGGASSAGEAYQTLTATEQQRRQGTIQSAYDTAMQQIGTYKANLTDKYNTALADLETQKNAALNEANRNFRDALQQIQSAKLQAQSDKATASMNVLQDLRNKVYTINAQTLQFQQQLALNNQQSLAQVDAYTQKVLQSVSGGQTALDTNAITNYNPTTAYGISSGTQATTTPTGATTKTWKQDETGNWVYT